MTLNLNLPKTALVETGVIALILCLGYIDVLLPFGFAFCIAYTLPLLLGVSTQKKNFTVVTFILCIVAIGIDFALSTGSRAMGVVNTSLSVLSLAVTLAFVVVLQKSKNALEQRVKQQRSIALLGRRAMSGVNLSVLFDEMTHAMQTQLRSDYAAIIHHDNQKNRSYMIAGAGWRDGVVGVWNEEVTPDSMEYATYNSDKPFVVQELLKDKRFKPAQFMIEHGVRSTVSVVIPGEPIPFGIMQADTSQAHHFTEDDIFYLKALANIITDAVRIKSYEERLTKANAELEQFSSIASHDLQEPLRKIRTLNERIEADSSVKNQENRSKIDFSVQRMQKLIDNLLVFSRLKTKPVQQESIDLAAIVKEVMNDLEMRIHEANAIVTVGAMLSVRGNYTQFMQLFTNLISNSIKYRNKERSPVVHVSSRRLENGDYEITVQDNGVGFDEKFVNQIFEPFKRLHDRREFEGTGMGLAICQKIVHQYDGKIAAKSQPGNGATFIITFPAKVLSISG